MLNLLGACISIARVPPLLLSLVLEEVCASDSLILNITQVAQELAALAVHVRLGLGSVDQSENALCLAEDAVHFFKTAVGSFGVEEVDNGEDEGVSVVVRIASKKNNGGPT